MGRPVLGFGFAGGMAWIWGDAKPIRRSAAGKATFVITVKKIVITGKISAIFGAAAGQFRYSENNML